MRRTAAAVLGLVAAAGCHRRGPPPPPPDRTAGGPRLVVLVGIDQLPRWGFDQRRGQYQHGLARLLREGTLLTGAYPYATTFTAPGHAALATGAPPSVTGVIANVWYRREQGEERLAERDDTAALLAIADRQPAPGPGASSRIVRVPGIAEALRSATGGRGRSVAIAGKPRAGCFALGHPDLALWYEPGLVGFTSSTAYVPALPDWAVELDRAHPLTARLADVWIADDPAGLAAATGIADDAAGEAGDYGAGATFPPPPPPPPPRCAPRPRSITPRSTPPWPRSPVRGWAPTTSPICSRCRSRPTTSSATPGARSRGRCSTSSAASIASSIACSTASIARSGPGATRWC